MKGYRTIAFNAIMATVVFLQDALGVDVSTAADGLIAYMTSLEGFLTEAWVAGNIWLRAVTDSPVFKKS